MKGWLFLYKIYFDTLLVSNAFKLVKYLIYYEMTAHGISTLLVQ